jgi:MerR family Zn(II)-responsive transcriptional regulator of zntA
MTMQVSELSRRSGVGPEVIRYYSRIGLLKPTRNPENKYRVYQETDLKRLQFVRNAKRLGFTLSEISEIVRESRKGESPCPKVRNIIRHRIAENRKTLDELARMQNRMEKALTRWEEMPDGVPDGHSVCHLIESAGEL